MSKPGRTPTPTAIGLARGSHHVKYRNRREPKPKTAVPSAPTWLSREAKAEWGRVAPELHELGVLALIDRAALSAYCQSWGDYCAAVKAAAKEGMTLDTARGTIKNPMMTVLNETRAAMLRFAQELGLTPAARTRIQVDKGTGSDELDALLRLKTG